MRDAMHGVHRKTLWPVKSRNLPQQTPGRYSFVDVVICQRGRPIINENAKILSEWQSVYIIICVRDIQTYCAVSAGLDITHTAWV